MDAMEVMDLLSGSNTHLSKLSSDGNMAAAAGAAAASAATTAAATQAAQVTTAGAGAIKIAPSNGPSIFPGIKYRNIGKTGLKCSNIGLGSIRVFNQDNPEIAEDIVTLAYESG